MTRAGLLTRAEHGTILLCSQQLWHKQAAEMGGEKRALCCRSRAGIFRHRYGKGTGSNGSGVLGGLSCAAAAERRGALINMTFSWHLECLGSISHSLPSAVGGEDICCLRRKGLHLLSQSVWEAGRMSLC